MSDDEPAKNPQWISVRVLLAVVLLLLIAAYAALVVTGKIPENGRLNAVDLTIIVAAVLASIVLLRPGLTDRLRLLELKGIKIEFLERLRERQLRQEHDLEDIGLIIPLLFRDTERKHVSNLARGKTGGYHGGNSLREELRRLCSIGLLRRRGDHKISELSSNLEFDLRVYVELTELGQRWARRLAQIDEAASEPSETNA
jgi:DNA-binding HxlR family transcriptional regulator